MVIVASMEQYTFMSTIHHAPQIAANLVPFLSLHENFFVISILRSHPLGAAASPFYFACISERIDRLGINPFPKPRPSVRYNALLAQRRHVYDTVGNPLYDVDMMQTYAEHSASSSVFDFADE